MRENADSSFAGRLNAGCQHFSDNNVVENCSGTPDSPACLQLAVEVNSGLQLLSCSIWKVWISGGGK